MDRPTAYTLPLPSVYEILTNSGFPSDAEVIRNSFPGKDTSLRRAKRGLAVDILRSKGLFDKFISDYWPNGLTMDGKRRLERYARCFEELKRNDVQDEEPNEEEKTGDEFAYESDLREYLAKNPSVIEPGMSLWSTGEVDQAVEFVVEGGRRIDILGKDSKGVPVVIELKVSRGHERVIGQALYYRGCIKEMFTVQKVRIVIIARDITPELKIATRDLPDVDLFEYRLSVSLTRILQTASHTGPTSPTNNE